MAGKRKMRWDRVALVFLPVILLILLVLVWRDKDEGGNGGKNSDSKSSSSVDSQNSGAKPAQKSADEYVVVLDAGHGGRDSGTMDVTGNRLEKDDNLKLALAVRDALETYSHVRVIMTRESDVGVSLEDRCQIANDANADVFVSLHRNSADEGNGIEIWVSNKDTGTGDKRLAGYIMELLEDVGISKNRGIRAGYRTTFDGDNYYVNLYTKMPSCLVEMGFMTSDIDNTYFDQRMDAYADAIATGIIEYGGDLGLYEAGT